MQPFTIPSSSLEKSLLIGDFLFVSKFHYGPRTPMTTVAAPMVHDTIPFVKVKSYLYDDNNPESWKHKLQLRRRHLIASAAPLHDIGKVGVPDAILLKPGKLTPLEFNVMKTHARIGADALEDAIRRVVGEGWEALLAGGDEGPLAFLTVARQIALSHHEKWDGSGYPAGLAGEDIPLPGRLMAIVDVFDALTCRRHYKEAFSFDQAVTIIDEGRGRHFDPDLVDAMHDCLDEFAAIAAHYADEY